MPKSPDLTRISRHIFPFPGTCLIQLRGRHLDTKPEFSARDITGQAPEFPDGVAIDAFSQSFGLLVAYLRELVSCSSAVELHVWISLPYCVVNILCPRASRGAYSARRALPRTRFPWFLYLLGVVFMGLCFVHSSWNWVFGEYPKIMCCKYSVPQCYEVPLS